MSPRDLLLLELMMASMGPRGSTDEEKAGDAPDNPGTTSKPSTGDSEPGVGSGSKHDHDANDSETEDPSSEED